MRASASLPPRATSPESSPPARLPPERAAVAPQLIFNQQLDAWLTIFFTAVLWFVIADMVRIAVRHLRGLPPGPGAEAPYRLSKLQLVSGQPFQSTQQAENWNGVNRCC